ncbi:hypothetical protein [Nonomuraea phyllanthi]|uniref:hypothetical protein n=1 Tax=Nonomuraea phyllanthi TaxID=2219224 RepID=UPI001D018BC8|nr:hypothetical protein [Nonomuraea phyllanthi]
MSLPPRRLARPWAAPPPRRPRPEHGDRHRGCLPRGAAVKALARQHRVAPKTIRRVLDAAGARYLSGPLGMPPIRPGELDDVLVS